LPLALAGYLVRVRFEDSATAEFVCGYLISDHGRAVRKRMAKAAVNQANINASEMRKIVIAHPPRAVKESYEEALSAICGQRSVIERALAADDALFASLQSRAFRGEL
jgi:type I restriction enzyme S subunit